MCDKELSVILNTVQKNESCHEKYILILKKLYDRTPFEEFFTKFIRNFKILLTQSHSNKNVYVDRFFKFVTKFTAKLAKDADAEQLDSSESSQTPAADPLRERLLNELLELQDVDEVDIRYRICQFFNLLLTNTTDGLSLSDDTWAAIDAALLDRIVDSKPAIRLQAVIALSRLQQPSDACCRIVNGLIDSLYDPSPLVRKEAVAKLGINLVTISEILELIQDIDYSVRLATFQRLAIIGPKLLKIVERRTVIHCGFGDKHKSVRAFFKERLLPKWTDCFNGNFLKLLTCLKLDSNENDIKSTIILFSRLLKVLYQLSPLTDVVEQLPLVDKMVPKIQLNLEVATYWHTLVAYLKTSHSTEDYLDDILPSLPTFCSYIESYFKEKSNEALDSWQIFEFQSILQLLFKIVKQYDFGDEAGRRVLIKLITHILIQGKLAPQVISELLEIATDLIPNLDMLAIDICDITSQIQEATVLIGPNPDQIRENEFKLAQLNVKINILQEEQIKAVEKQDFVKAAATKEKLAELHQDLQEQFQEGPRERVVKNDEDTLCRCLNIILAFLSLPKLNYLPPAMRTSRNEFFLPLLKMDNPEIRWRVLKCNLLCSLVDKDIMNESLKSICAPIIFHHVSNDVDPMTLETSIRSVSDLVRVYGANIFKIQECTNDNSENRQGVQRQLYRKSLNYQQANDADFDSLTLDDIMNKMLDMLDDDEQKIRESACAALIRLTLNGTTNPTIIARLLLKWFNPLTEKQDLKLIQEIGPSLLEYSEKMQDGEKVVGEAVLPTLISLINAPRGTPLAGVDIDNALRFLAAITNIKRRMGIINTHKHLCYMICTKIGRKPNDRCSPVFIKFLLHLEPPSHDNIFMRELITLIEPILEDVHDKTANKNLKKFFTKLKVAYKPDETVNGAQIPISMEVQENASLLTTPTIKRRKQRGEKSQVSSDTPSTSSLQPILEKNLVKSNENVCDSDSPKSSPPEEQVIISDTSSDSEPADQRKSRRKRIKV